MSSTRHEIVIAGASFAGLALALALRKAAGADLDIDILEAAGTGASPRPDQRAFALSAASTHLLQAIGLWERVRNAAQPVTAINVSAGRLASPLRQTLLHYDNHAGDGEPASFILPAAILREALLAELAATGLAIDAGSAIVGTTPSATGIRLDLAGGRQIEAALCIATDGRRSPSRDLMGIKSLAWSYPQAAIVTTVTHSEDHQGVATQHFLEAGPFAILPLTGGHRSSLVWSERTEVAQHIMALDDADFLSELQQRFGGILGDIGLAGPRVSHPLELRLARSLIAERFALAGDAARSVHPIAGQGLNLGLRDVGALAETIIDARRLGLDVGSPGILRRYEQWRRFDSVMSAAAMDGLNRLFSNDNGVLRTLREAGLGLTDRMPGLKRFLVTEAAGLTGLVPKLLAGELP